jgi:hypothetical protein
MSVWLSRGIASGTTSNPLSLDSASCNPASATLLFLFVTAFLGASRTSALAKVVAGLRLRTFLGFTTEESFPDPGFLIVENLAAVLMLPVDFLETALVGVLKWTLGLALSVPTLLAPGGGPLPS